LGQVLGSFEKLCLSNKRIDLPVNALKGFPERVWHAVMGSFLERNQGRVEDSGIESGKEDGDSSPIGGKKITIGGRNSGDDPFEPESPEIISHLAGCVMIGCQKGSHLYPEATVGESIDEMNKQRERQEKTHHPRVSKLHAWCSLTVMLGGLNDPLDGLSG